MNRKQNTTFFMIVILLGILVQLNAQATNSAEFMCKTKAKEIAAETYKNCVTDAKQTQVKSLRKEYEEKLSQLKNHYDKELKKLSSGGAQTSSQTKVDTSARVDSDSLESKQPAKSEKFTKRLSGAREISNPTDNNTDSSTVEVVEIPAEQE